MANFLPSARPAWAVTAWVDDNNIYVEIPVTNGPPYVTKYAFSDAGLSKALGQMRDIYRAQAPTGGSYNLTRHPILVAKDQVKSKNFTDDQRASARDVLKKMKNI